MKIVLWADLRVPCPQEGRCLYVLSSLGEFTTNVNKD